LIHTAINPKSIASGVNLYIPLPIIIWYYVGTFDGFKSLIDYFLEYFLSCPLMYDNVSEILIILENNLIVL